MYPACRIDFENWLVKLVLRIEHMNLFVNCKIENQNLGGSYYVVYVLFILSGVHVYYLACADWICYKGTYVSAMGQRAERKK